MLRIKLIFKVTIYIDFKDFGNAHKLKVLKKKLLIGIFKCSVQKW